MKTKITILAMLMAIGAFAQNTKTIAVLNIDTKDIVQNSTSICEMIRLELEKTNTYSVMDKYEVEGVVSKIKIDSNNRYSKTFLVKAGKQLGVDNILSGSVERMGERIIITLRMIDVASGTIEKTSSTEYFNLPEVQRMLAISVKKLLGIQSKEADADQLIYYDMPIQSQQNKLQLNGPRFGLASTLGKAGEILTKPKNEGGFDMFPITFDFGWQQEFQYLSAGKFQALVENIFTIAGVESGKIIPSYTPMLGFRFGKKAYEFAFGPTFRFVKKAEGYKDTSNTWHLRSDWYATESNGWAYDPGYFDSNNNYHKYEIKKQIDSRGTLSLSTGLVVAFGRTFHSGYLNIPVNIYVAPRKDGTTVGFMMGFNILKKKKVE